MSNDDTKNDKDLIKNDKTLTTVETEYGVDQITDLEGLEAVRKRPGMYIGSTSQKGINHLVWEIADNSIDEFVAGHGEDIWVTVAKDCSVTIRDNGRGIPVGPHSKWQNEDGTPQDTLIGILTRLHAGGKFNGAGSGYKVSGGLHGIGSKAANALSDRFRVQVRRGGKIYQQDFSRGKPLHKDPIIVGTCDLDDTGTETTYHPDAEIFKTTLEPNCKDLQDRMSELASLNAGLSIYYTNEITGFVNMYYYEDGIIGYVKRLVKEKPFLYPEPIYIKGEYKIDDHRIIIVEISLIHDNDDNQNEVIKSFANNINTHEGGFHHQGFRDSYRKIINKFAIDNKLTKDNIEIKYLMEGIYAIVSVKVPEAEFEGQTKTKLGNEEAKIAVETIFETGINQLLSLPTNEPVYRDILASIVMKALTVKEAEEAARKARQLVKQNKKVKNMALPGKLADCNKNSEYSELYIVEGDSAGGSAKQGRNREFQAILSLRGKLLNVEKSTLERLLKSDTITNIIGAIGTGIIIADKEMRKNFGEFDSNKVRYDKIIIMSDADVDGSHIMTLLLTLFYNYMRPLIELGFVYIAQPPLFRVVGKKGDSTYLKDDHALKEHRKKYPNAEVNRFKGLGEMNPKQLWETTMDPERRTLLRISLNDAARAAESFNTLMGADVRPRKEFIENNAHKVDLTFD